MRAWPRAKDQMSGRRSLEIPGLPIRRDFQRQNNLNPWRCQPVKVSGRTAINASFQSNSLLRHTNRETDGIGRPVEAELDAHSRGPAVCAKRDSRSPGRI